MYGKHHLKETKNLMSETRKEKFKNKELNLKGENNSQSILTEKDVIKIWKYLNEGILNQKEIARKFGINRSTISNIKLGKRWNHIKENCVKC